MRVYEISGISLFVIYCIKVATYKTQNEGLRSMNSEELSKHENLSRQAVELVFRASEFLDVKIDCELPNELHSNSVVMTDEVRKNFLCAQMILWDIASRIDETRNYLEGRLSSERSKSGLDATCKKFKNRLEKLHGLEELINGYPDEVFNYLRSPYFRYFLDDFRKTKTGSIEIELKKVPVDIFID